MRPSNRNLKLLSETVARAAPLVPEIALHLAPADRSFDAFRTQIEPLTGVAPPYWAVVWPGGQAIARHILDHPTVVAGLRVIDIGAGSALASIAAVMAGAAHVLAIDTDPISCAIAQENAALNGISIETREGDFAAIDPNAADVVLAGDLWYEPLLARRATSSLRALARQGAVVIAGDPDRSAFPRSGVLHLGSYTIEAREEFERAARIDANVWRFS